MSGVRARALSHECKIAASKTARERDRGRGSEGVRKVSGVVFEFEVTLLAGSGLCADLARGVSAARRKSLNKTATTAARAPHS